MELELKHLASYLPYGLKFELNLKDIQVNYKNEIRRFTMTCSNVDLCLTHGGKPILRPLSDLTKEIDGVVHLVELAEIQYEYNIDNYKLQSKYLDGIFAFGVNYINDDKESMVFGYDTYNGFGLHIKPMNDILFVSNQLKLYEYLFQYHFDVYGLIEKGLAIDINTVENV